MREYDNDMTMYDSETENKKVAFLKKLRRR